MGVCGQYVRSFAEASHALPNGMHMNADYPFMIPSIVKLEGRVVTIKGRFGATETFPIRKDRRTKREYGTIHQVSTYERFFRGGKPSRWRMEPFKDQHTPAIATQQLELSAERD